MKTPPSEDVEVEAPREEGGRTREPKGKNAKGKNVGWKDKDSEKEKLDKKNESGFDSDIGIVLTKEIKRSEESLHTRLGRLITKELDKQSEYSGVRPHFHEVSKLSVQTNAWRRSARASRPKTSTVRRRS